MKEKLLKAGIIGAAMVAGATAGVLVGKGLSNLVKEDEDTEPVVDPVTFEACPEEADDVGTLDITQDEE